MARKQQQQQTEQHLSGKTESPQPIGDQAEETVEERAADETDNTDTDADLTEEA